MYEYSWFIQRIKTYISEEKNLDRALTRTIQDCEKEGIMVDFVRKHGSEAVNMLFTQFNMDDALEVRYEEGFEDGFANGAEKGLTLKLIQMVSSKLQRGKSLLKIAEEVEETPETVEKICQAIKDSNTDDVNVIYERLHK